MKFKIAILGTGTWGTALGRLLCGNGHEVIMWSALPQEIEYLTEHHRHPKLQDIELPASITYTGDMEAACTGRDIIVMAVPSVFVRSTVRAAKPYFAHRQIVVDVAKGIEPKTLKTMTQIIEEECGADNVRVVALSGPTHAEEVIRDIPSAIVSACNDLDVARTVQNVFSNDVMSFL